MKEENKNAIEIIKQMIADGQIAQNVAEKYFPELKESEDEDIRTKLLNLLKELLELGGVAQDTWSMNDCKQFIAWLEKQGTPAKLSEEEQNRFAKVVLTSCASSFIDYLDAHRYEGKMCVSNGECEDIENAFHNAMWDRLHRYYCKYIEKQGEQKPIDPVALMKDYFANTPKEQQEKDWAELKHLNDVGFGIEIPFGAKDSELQEWSYYIPEGFYAEIESNRVVIKKGEQKPADKVEPRFKVGDTVTVKSMSCHGKVFKGKSFKIVDIIEDNYVSDDGKTYSISLQDGWELVEQKPTDTDNKFIRMRETKPKDISEFLDRLTTVEQEFLWEHIAKIRELDKEEQKPAWSEEDEEYCQCLIKDIENSDPLPTSIYSDCKNWLKSLKSRVQPKQEWNEEDKDMLEHCIGAINAADYYTFDDKIEMEKWLKSLKERCLPQQKQEWSEEDERNLNDAILFIETGTYSLDKDNLINWLKSLRPQNRWKPSDEQMHYLSWIANIKLGDSVVEQEVSKHLNELLEDLKKLREE